MASLDGLRRRLKEARPHIQSAFVVYLTPVKENPIPEPDPDIEIRTITSGDDPLLPKICARWQLARARKEIDAGNWDVIVGLKDGVPIGRIWETFTDERAFFSGVPRVRLAKGEILMFDLFVDREYRRSNIAMTMAHYFFDLYLQGKGSGVDYVYGFISYENGPSVLWHHSIGFNIVQTMNYLAVGDRIKWRIPFSDMPRFGPMSKKGRHTDPSVDLFGTQLRPQTRD
jgi:hypothetical protein